MHPCILPFFEAVVLRCAFCSQIRLIPRLGAVCINFVEHHQCGFVQIIDFTENLVDRLDVLFKIGMGNVYHMQQQICFLHLVQSAFKRLDQLGWQFTDKPDRIAQQKRQITNNHFANGGIECSKKFVFGKTSLLAMTFISVDLPTLV